ncbi:MAG: hypothetical protein O8C67_09590, partial [Candidatus Methanoperedens sp.]|nr:hypothetical protein [Candidatus Methanoperedens sp.]
AEQIQHSFPSLTLRDVYGAIFYYLERTEEVETYLASQEKQAEEIELLGDEIIDEVFESYFEEAKDEIKREAMEEVEEEIKDLLKTEIVKAVRDYIRAQLEDKNLIVVGRNL